MARNQGPDGHPGDRAYPAEWPPAGERRSPQPPAAPPHAHYPAGYRPALPAQPAPAYGGPPNSPHAPSGESHAGQLGYEHSVQDHDQTGRWPQQPPQWPAEPAPYHYPRGQVPEALSIPPQPPQPPAFADFPPLPGAGALRGADYDQHPLPTHQMSDPAPLPYPTHWQAPQHGGHGHAGGHVGPDAHDGYGQPDPRGFPTAANAPQAYAPAPQAYASAPQAYAPVPQGYPNGYAPQPAHDPQWTQDAQWAQAPAQSSAQPYAQPTGFGEPDPRGYHLSQYDYPHGQEPGVPQAAAARWDGQQQGYPQGYGQLGYGEDPTQPYQQAHQPGAYPQQQPAGEQYADEEYEDEPAPRRRGTLLVVASLVGAIIAGGGMAYAYKSFFGSDGKRGTPIVKADKRPAKATPDERGGREFQNTNSKLLSRLDSQNGARGDQTSSVAGRGSEDGRVRAVPTVVVGRDGSVVAQQQANSPPTMQASPLPGATVVVPGTSLSGGFGGNAPAPVNPAPVYQPSARSNAVPPAVLPAPINRSAPPDSDPEPPSSRVTAAPRYRGPPLPERPAGSSVVQRAQPAAQAATAPRRVAAVEPRPEPPAAAGGNGFVAVLSSSPSQIDALKAFADLQQKYPTVLQSRTPEVREADLSTRGLGKMYRAVVGPPGSRQAAAGICSQLKSAGYTGCWVSAY